jgi:uncharacterized membrane protein
MVLKRTFYTTLSMFVCIMGIVLMAMKWYKTTSENEDDGSLKKFTSGKNVEYRLMGVIFFILGFVGAGVSYMTNDDIDELFY